MTAENFQACLAFTLKYEGGRSNDPRDPGGRTMEGVTQATYDASHEKKALGLRDVFTMGAAERDEIYRNEYWNAVNGDRLRAGEDLCVFDFAVNSGPARALEVWRRCGASKDSREAIVHDICAHRLSFLHALRIWSAFGAGWGRRVAACEALAPQMAGVPLNGALARARTEKAIAGIGAAGAAILHHTAYRRLGNGCVRNYGYPCGVAFCIRIFAAWAARRCPCIRDQGHGSARERSQKSRGGRDRPKKRCPPADRKSAAGDQISGSRAFKRSRTICPFCLQ